MHLPGYQVSVSMRETMPLHRHGRQACGLEGGGYGGEEHAELSGLVRRSPSSTGSRGPTRSQDRPEEDVDVTGVTCRSTSGSDGLAEEYSGDFGVAEA